MRMMHKGGLIATRSASESIPALLSPGEHFTRMHILKVDEKWSIGYLPDHNDKPVKWFRYEEEHSVFDENNAVVAMFYILLERTRTDGN